MLSPEEREELRRRLSERSGPHYKPNKLTPEQREAIPLMYLEGLSAVAIARTLGVRPQTISYHLRRAANG